MFHGTLMGFAGIPVSADRFRQRRGGGSFIEKRI